MTNIIEKYKKTIQFFQNNLESSHPIWWLRGDTNFALEVAKEMVFGTTKIGKNDARTFFLSKESDDLLKFISYAPLNYRGCICIMDNISTAKMSYLLKIIEEPPKKTHFIIISQALPEVYANRIGFVYTILADIDLSNIMKREGGIFLDEIDDETDAICTFIALMIKNIKEDIEKRNYKNLDSMYEILSRMIEIYDYVIAKRMLPSDGLQACVELVSLNHISELFIA